MADGTKIEWTDATINPIRARRIIRSADDSEPVEARMGWHCEHVSEACRHCYAEAINRDRFGTGLDYRPGHLANKGGEVEIVFVDKPIRDMLRWRRPRRVFVCSMTDLFADFVPDAMIDRVFAAMALAPHHTFQVLTKRPERMRAYLRANPGIRIRSEMPRLAGPMPVIMMDWPLPNVWLGVTAERQTEADERIPILLDTPAAKRFVSIEPMLGAINLESWLNPAEACVGCDDGYGFGGRCKSGHIPREEQCPWNRAVQVVTEHGPYDADGTPASVTSEVRSLDWVICGGESGPNARPMSVEWAKDIRDQCVAAGTAFFMKQMSGKTGAERAAIPADLLVREFPDAR